MNKIELLSDLKLGSSVAEYDRDLDKYFINTNYVKELINNDYDIIRGVKGAGKTAMLVALTKNKGQYEKLKSVKLVQAINLTGDPDFKKAFDRIDDDVEQQMLVDAWKIYLINIAWKNVDSNFEKYNEVKKYLKENNLITIKDSFLDKILYSFQRVMPTKVTNTFNIDGSTTQALEFDRNVNTTDGNIQGDTPIIDFNNIFTKINDILKKNNCSLWIMMDRLDDAFPDKSKKSILALKTLFYAYKDISLYDNFKIKMFIRDDIYNDITDKRFTSLTHVAANTSTPIKWDREKLENLFIERLLYNENFKSYLQEMDIDYTELNEQKREIILQKFFKKQVDVGRNNPDSFGWIINHITDGLNIFTPRDLISLIDKAKHYQIEEWRLTNNSEQEDYFIGAAALRKAYETISKDKLDTQLYAEYPELKRHIEKFKDLKAEHNEDSLRNLLGLRWKSIIEKLVNIGFIEEKKSTKIWKIPFLYRAGLGVIQGKAY